MRRFWTIGNHARSARPSYSRHLETLMAVVTHLAVHKWSIRQPRGIAKDLSIDEADVRDVLDTFKGLFRRSIKTSDDHGAPFYSLHLRFARQGSDENQQQDKAPLESEYLIPLLEFISENAREERKNVMGLKIAMLTAGLSLIASLITLAIAIFRH